ncbi:MAG: Uncharacterized protein XD42_1051 [Thermodesulfobacterium sp. 37_54]|uniref:Uncharacterized protein n=1 Tax=Thermodesulfobacterium commune TaxID=1741 RepID=A0A101FJW7_9BACT|nr:MAG: Uncharacterized protein XD42_1051 [Thermodesulfobacterium sp. 37_54]KUK19156.1 MAG: Uncharacterized protein XD55_0783 [Thermodesulfobacterium commune]MDK2861605.1 hypothetical protein [Thermodesulfobacterium sp.]KUK38383.1 MAG: Uncharacterized protein XD67_0312 [Thermodesulfobacterium commune]HAA83910.1 hypothetical protein [Thermodesulfobacterium commune]
MRKLIALLVGVSLLGFSLGYAQGPKEGPAGPKPYQGAGIGKEVSNATKQLKGEEAKKGFGKQVRERAREKSRIREHKALKQQQKEILKKGMPGNSTSQ